MNDRDKIIDKIKKCLALSASSNEHEAEAALRQARKLMEAHGITDLEMQAAQASERRQQAGAQVTPSNWETGLSSRIARAFGCTVFYYPGSYAPYARRADWVFVGCGAAPEIGGYAFEVLQRQCKRAREQHIKTKLKRCRTATKTRRADLFCEGWVVAVAGKIEAFAGSDQQSDAIDAYLATHYPRLSNLTPRDRNDGRNLRDHEYDDLIAGKNAGRNAELNRGVGGEQQRQIGG
jgi:hypothetical protein